MLYKVNDCDDGAPELKGRLFFHINCYKYRYAVLRDSTSAYLSPVSLMLSLSLMLDFEIATADVRETYM